MPLSKTTLFQFTQSGVAPGSVEHEPTDRIRSGATSKIMYAFFTLSSIPVSRSTCPRRRPLIVLGHFTFLKFGEGGHGQEPLGPQLGVAVSALRDTGAQGVAELMSMPPLGRGLCPI